MSNYEDIIDIEYTGVRQHRRMPIGERAVIMASFNALTGLDQELGVAAQQAQSELLADDYDDMPDSC